MTDSPMMGNKATDASKGTSKDRSIEELFNWLDQQPELQYLRDKAGKTLCAYRPLAPTVEQRFTIAARPQLDLRKGWLRQLIEVIWVPGESMRGKAYATPELDSSLNTVAKVMSIASLWDFFTTIPLFQASLSNPLAWAAGPAGAGLSFILLWASNAAGEASTDRRPGHRGKATWSLAAFILLSTAKTAFSGVGVDLWIGSKAIASNYAAELATAKLAKDQSELKRLESEGADFKIASQRCSDLQKQMAAIDRNSNDKQYVSLFVQAYGSNAVTTADRGKNPKQLIGDYGSVASIPGVCRQRDVLQALNIEKAKPLASAIERKKLAIASKPPLIYLQQEEPDLYAEHFKTVNGRLEWVNGTEAVGQATNQFYASLLAGEFGLLGFSLFTLSVSVILSGAAALLIYYISRDLKVEASHESSLAPHRQQQLEQYAEMADAAGYRIGAPIESVDAKPGDEEPATLRGDEEFQTRRLDDLGMNGNTVEDRAYAKQTYHKILFELWRQHMAATGQTYYPELSDDLLDHYKLARARNS